MRKAQVATLQKNVEDEHKLREESEKRVKLYIQTHGQILLGTLAVGTQAEKGSNGTRKECIPIIITWREHFHSCFPAA